MTTNERNERIEELRHGLSVALTNYCKVLDDRAYVSGWTIVTEIRTPKTEQNGGDPLYGIITAADQSVAETCGLIDIAFAQLHH